MEHIRPPVRPAQGRAPAQQLEFEFGRHAQGWGLAEAIAEDIFHDLVVALQEDRTHRWGERSELCVAIQRERTADRLLRLITDVRRKTIKEIRARIVCEWRPGAQSGNSNGERP